MLQRTPALFSGSFFVTLVLLSTLSDPVYVGPELLEISVAALLPSATLYWLLVMELPGTSVVVVLTSLAYFVGAQLSLLQGYREGMLQVLPRFVLIGLLAHMVFLCASAGISATLVRSRPLQWLTGSVVRVADFAGVGAFRAAFVLLFLATVLASAMTGALSFYSGGARVTGDGGFRLELFYPSLLFAMFAFSTYRATTVQAPTGRLAWGASTVATAALLFILQSRRMAVGSMTLGGLLILVEYLRSGRLRASLRGRRLLQAGLVGAVFLAGMLWLSPLWRYASTEGGLGARAEATAERFSEGGTGEAALDSSMSRLTYLWLAAASIQYFPEGGRSSSLVEVLTGDVAWAVPGALFPDKYLWDVSNCESQFAKHNIEVDLACTPLDSAWTTAGWPGVLLALLGFSFALALNDGLLTRGGSGWLLGAVGTAVLCKIEDIVTFPVLFAMRGMAVTLAVTIPICLLLAFLRPRRPGADVRTGIPPGGRGGPTAQRGPTPQHRS